jgi:MoaA/NifB/PqqE/SkfB family radical SAM enzyme
MYPFLKDDWFLYKTPEGGILFYGGFPYQKVNTTGASILELCDGTRDVTKICQFLAIRYGDEISRVKAKVGQFLEDSERRGCLGLRDKPSLRKYFLCGNSQLWAPYYVSLEITQKCDLKCIHCYANASIMKSPEITTQQWIEILSEFHDLGTLTVNLTGGDPFTYDGIFKILDYCEGKFKVVIPTNGFRIKEDTARRLSKYECIDHIQVSLDGPDERTHDAIRGRKGSFEKAVGAIKWLTSSTTLNVFVSMILLPQNEKQIEETIKLAKALSVKVFGVGKLFRIGRARDELYLTKAKLLELDALIVDLSRRYSDDNFLVRQRDYNFLDPGLACDRLSPDDMIRIGDRLIKLMGGNCGAGCRSIFIKSNGDIIPCNMMEKVMGNALENGVRKMLQSPVTQNVFRSIRSPNSAICDGCENNILCMGCIAQAYIQSQHGPCNWRITFENRLSCTE